MQGRNRPKMMEKIEYIREVVPNVSTNDVDEQGKLLNVGVEMSRRSISRNRGERWYDLE
jgi:hypothetical protein